MSTLMAGPIVLRLQGNNFYAAPLCGDGFVHVRRTGSGEWMCEVYFNDFFLHQTMYDDINHAAVSAKVCLEVLGYLAQYRSRVRLLAKALRLSSLALDAHGEETYRTALVTIKENYRSRLFEKSRRQKSRATKYLRWAAELEGPKVIRRIDVPGGGE